MTLKRILVVGGAGTFGFRLAERLLGSGQFEVVIGGRDAERLARAAAELRTFHPAGAVSTHVIDASRATAQGITGLRLFAVVDASGPFQGVKPIMAAVSIVAGCHFVDLADARDYAAVFGGLDAAARRSGVVALTGASSTPALSNAVVDKLTRNWRRIDHVFVGIVPGNQAPRGLSTMQAILGWVGRPVTVFLDGRWQTRSGWGLLEKREIAGLGPRLLSLAETPDLDVLAARAGPTRSAIVKAGLELPVLHLGLHALAILARLPGVPPLPRFAAVLRRLAERYEYAGTDRGGMIVEVIGVEAAGRRVKATWTLIAEAGSGPTVPTLPAVAAVKIIAGGNLLPRAASAAGKIPYEAIEAEWADLPIRAETVVEEMRPLFARALGEPAFARLPTPLRMLHGPAPTGQWEGRGDVEGASNPLAWLLARAFGLPRAGSDVPVEVTIEDMSETGEGAEVWTRTFAGRRFASRLAATGATGEIEERFGPLTFKLALEADAAGLTMRVVGWRIGRLILPTRLAARGSGRETVDAEGRFRFEAEFGLPMGMGRMAAYRGWLKGAG